MVCLLTRKFFLFIPQSLGFDGGEYRNMAGQFNLLSKVTPEMWDMMEKMIRSSNKKQK